METKDGKIYFDKHGYYIGCSWPTDGGYFRVCPRNGVPILVYNMTEVETVINESRN